MTEATVCIPWRPGPARLAIRNRCVDFWHRHGFPVIEADSDPDLPFLANQARNNAVREAGSDVVILADADTIPGRIEQIHCAVEQAVQGVVVWPHTVQNYADSRWVSMPLSAAIAKRVEAGGFSGSLIVIHRETFWSIGGFDERFTPGMGGWDDVSFAMCAATLLKVVRVVGHSWSFEIEGSEFCNQAQEGPNWDRFLLYAQANKQGEAAMRELLATRPEVTQA